MTSLKDGFNKMSSDFQPSGWRKLRNIVQWTPFFQTYKKQRYPWVQLAGHQGNFKAGPDQGTILKKLCAKEEKCFKVRKFNLLIYSTVSEFSDFIKQKLNLVSCKIYILYHDYYKYSENSKRFFCFSLISTLKLF